MNPTICLAAKDTLRWPKAAGHFWVFLNWALGLRALGCRVLWLERVTPDLPKNEIPDLIVDLTARLEAYDLKDSLVLSWEIDRSESNKEVDGSLTLEEAAEADLLLNLGYDIPVVGLFRRSAFVDIDPGLTQIWIAVYGMKIARHDTYFTIGETVGQPDALFPDCGLRWHYTPPPVYLPQWPQSPAPPAAAFTTVVNWWGGWMKYKGEEYDNGKRAGFLPFLDLPRHTTQPLELAVCQLHTIGDDEMLRRLGWRLREAWEVTSTPSAYQRYVQSSLGEFSCVKPSCVRLQNAWISDRSLCYLASGKPVVVQHTGPSRFLPDRAGLFRFRDINEAVECLNVVANDYDHQCRLARDLAEKHFDAKVVVSRVLEKALA